MKNFIPIKYTVIISFLAIVGAIFTFKYSARISESANLPFLIAAIFTFGYLAFFAFLWRFDLGQYTWASNKRLLVAAMTVLTLGTIVMVTVFPDTSRVTRLPAIMEWIERLLTGEFPWGDQTQYKPSGLPFLFIIALPFYYAGNVSFLVVLGVILFCVALGLLYPQPHMRWLPLSALVLLPIFYYELLVRSELLFNMVLVIMLIILSERYLDTNKLDIRFFGLATLFGFGLSTRTIIGLIYAGYYTFKFRRHIWHGILFSGFTLIIFGLTLMPFVIWNARIFFSEGPFTLQMSYLPVGVAALFAVIAAVTGWKAPHFRGILFSSGILLFVIVAIAFLSAVVRSGIYATVIKDGFDITYFIFCTPFLLLSLEKPS